MPKGLKPVRKRLAGGEVRIYWYHRATNQRLQADPATAEGFLEVARLDDSARATRAAARLLAGSYAALWAQYARSPEWIALKPRTRSDYQAVRDWLGDAADVPVSRIKTSDLVRLRDRAITERGRRFGNYVIQVLRLTLGWGVEREIVSANPAKGMKLIGRPKGARKVNRAWTVAELRAFVDAAPFQLLVPFVLALCAGMRQGDTLRVTWSAYTGRSLRWIASKNAEESIIGLRGPLRHVLVEARHRRGDAVQIAVNSYGLPWSQSGYRASFFKLLRALEADGKIQPGCTFHGLRHTIGSLARELGYSDSQVAAAIGDRSTAMAGTYGRDADKALGQNAVLGAVQQRLGNIEWKPRTPVSNRPRRG